MVGVDRQQQQRRPGCKLLAAFCNQSEPVPTACKRHTSGHPSRLLNYFGAAAHCTRAMLMHANPWRVSLPQFHNNPLTCHHRYICTLLILETVQEFVIKPVGLNDPLGPSIQHACCCRQPWPAPLTSWKNFGSRSRKYTPVSSSRGHGRTPLRDTATAALGQLTGQHYLAPSNVG